MKFLFVIQGEGRGHFSQALAMKEMLDDADHELVHVVVGISNQRKVPEYFINDIQSSISEIDSPNFAKTKDQKGISLWKTAWTNRNVAKYLNGSARKLKDLIAQYQPDRVINFYEPLVGITYFRYKIRIPYITVGHQYLHGHKDFPKVSGFVAQKRLLKWLNGISSYRSYKKLALSFKALPDQVTQRIFVSPPLLRKQIRSIKPSNEGHILGYMLNAGLAENIRFWHKKNRDEKAVFFWDKPTLVEHENLTFEGLSAKKFMLYMASSKGVITTAGFESLCEAKYLGKPLVFMPTPNHYEQLSNAIDAEHCQMGKHIHEYDPEQLVAYSDSAKSQSNEVFQNWVNKAPEIILKHLVS